MAHHSAAQQKATILSSIAGAQATNTMTTETFYVDIKTREIHPVEGNPREYWNGRFAGKADMIIEVFAHHHHLKEAYKLYSGLSMMKMTHNYTHIRVEVV